MLENIFGFLPVKDLNMYYCGKRIKTINHSYGPEIRKHFLIVLIKEGSATLYRSDDDIKLGAGKLLVMFPNEKIYYRVDEGSAWTISWIGVYGNVVYDFFEALDITPNRPVIDVKSFSAIEMIFENIYRNSFDVSMAGKTKCISMLYEFFSVLAADNDTERKYDYIEEALNIINFNYDKPITVANIADMLHLDQSYFSRLFKERIGVGPKEYILQKKVERACEIMKNGDISFKAMANSLGIKDQLYMSRLFKKKTGMTLTQYKKYCKLQQ